MAGLARVQFASYNMGPRGEKVTDDRAVVELNAIANNRPRMPHRRPKVIALTECIGRDLPLLDHYHPPIHDRSNRSRANLALYVRDDLLLGEPLFVQHHETWQRVEHPGVHEARATLTVRIHGGDTHLWVVLGHAPQVDGENTAKAREEWLNLTVGILRAHPRSLWLGDPNGLHSEVRDRMGDPKSVGFGTPGDAVLARGYFLDHVRLAPRANLVKMRSDHEHALMGVAVKR